MKPTPPILTVALFVLSTLVPMAWASHQTPEPPADEEYHARPRLISEDTALVPGQTQWIGVLFEIEDGWHTYWPGINDSGFPASIEITPTVHAKIGEIVWPTPHRHPYEGGLLDHVFEHQALLMIPITIDPGVTAERVTLNVKSDWLVCDEECIPEYATLSLELPIAHAGSMLSRSADAALFDQARKAQPLPWPASDSPQAIHQSWTHNTLAFHAGWAKKMAFYPSTSSRSPVDLLAQGAAQGPMLSIEFKPDDENHTPVTGLLEVWPETDGPSRVYAVRTTP